VCGRDSVFECGENPCVLCSRELSQARMNRVGVFGCLCVIDFSVCVSVPLLLCCASAGFIVTCLDLGFVEEVEKNWIGLRKTRMNCS